MTVVVILTDNWDNFSFSGDMTDTFILPVDNFGCLGVNDQRWRRFSSGWCEADGAVVGGSEPSVFDEEGDGASDGFKVGVAPSVGSHGVSDRELGVVGAERPVEQMFALDDAFVDSPLV